MPDTTGHDNMIIVSRSMIEKMVRDAVDEAMVMERADVYVMEDVDDLVQRVINVHIFPPVVDRTED